MKTKTILFLFLLLSTVVSAQVKRIAVLETVDKENKVSYANKLILRTSLSKAIANTAGYEVYDRTDIDAIMSEHTFQRTGLVSNDQIKRLGEMTGAKYILVAEAVKINAKNLFVTAKVLDVESARTIVTEMMEINVEHVQQGCTALAKKMFSNKRDLDFGEQIPVGTQFVRNSKVEQKLYGLGEYSYGETQMDKKALEAFLRNNSTEVYKRYLRNKNCIKAGWAMFGIGLVTAATGGACMILSDTYKTKKWLFYNEWYYNGDNYDDQGIESLKKAEDFYADREYSWMEMGVYLTSCGAGLVTIVSIPLLSCGYGMQNNIHKRYNEQAQLTLNLQSRYNGVGIALNF